jgi:dinuclear metal center YbgI/SA1388 family protein
MASLDRMVAYLDRELRVRDFEDSSHNGLQVANSGKVSRVCAGVDASMVFFQEAAGRGANLLVCHHGMSWGDSLRRITDLNYTRLKFLIEHDIALYACHLPLDAHPRLGNNAQLARALGLRGLKPFGAYHGREIGFAGALPKIMRYAEFKRRVEEATGSVVRSMDFGPQSVRTVAVVSGGAAEMVEEAGRKGLDVFVSGESKLEALHSAQEWGVHAIFAGHYATETFGVKAVARALASRFRVESDFVDLEIDW